MGYLAPIVVFVTSLLLGVVCIPVVRSVCVRLGKVSQPREDRWHRKPTATLGGVGIFIAFLGGLGVSLLVGINWIDRWGLLAGAALSFALGLYDDFKRMAPAAKLVGQILTAAVVISLGYMTHFFSPRIGNEILAQLPNIVLTFFWLVGITNAINLLDNMDGLAGGISLITAGFLCYFFWQEDQGLLAFALAVAGGTLAFLVYNFPPASIFMGDSGSLFLGFTLAVLAIARQPQASNVFAVMGVPIMLFLLPIMDTTLVTFTRLLRGQSPAQGGRDHTSHRLIAFGLNERQAVLALYAAALVAGLSAMVLESIRYWFSLVVLPLVLISLALLTAYLGGLKVVSANTAAERDKPLTRIMLELTFRRRMLEVILDFALICLAYYLAFLTRYGMVMNEGRLALYLQSLPVALAGAYLAFYTLGVYRGVWRYVDMEDLMRYLQASVGSMVLATAFVFTMDASGLSPWDETLSPLLFLLFAIFLFLALSGSRSSFKILDRVSKKRLRQDEHAVLILGAGDLGEMALRWILMKPELKYRPVGFLDEDPFKTGRWIHGVEVLGGMNQLESVLKRRQVEGVILAGVERNSPAWEELRETIQQQGCWVRNLSLDFETVE